MTAASLTDTCLASPNNSVYRTVAAASAFFEASYGAFTYHLDGSANPFRLGGTFVPTGHAAPNLFYIDATSLAVAGKTTKIRVAAQVLTNPTAPAITFTVGLYPIASGGSPGTIGLSGIVVPGSTVGIASPAASSTVVGNSGDISLPSDGVYGLGVVLSNLIPTDGVVLVSAQAQVRHV